MIFATQRLSDLRMYGLSNARLCAFSIITTAASTIAQCNGYAPSDMMLALMPHWWRMTIRAMRTPTGSETMATSIERRCQKYGARSATTMNSSISFWLRFSTSTIDQLATVVGSDRPGRQAFSSDSSLNLT